MRTYETICDGIRYEVTSGEIDGVHTTSMRPIGKVKKAKHRILNTDTGKTSCCDAYTSIGQDDEVEYCKACHCSITGYTGTRDLTTPTRHTIQL